MNIEEMFKAVKEMLKEVKEMGNPQDSSIPSHILVEMQRKLDCIIFSGIDTDSIEFKEATDMAKKLATNPSMQQVPELEMQRKKYMERFLDDNDDEYLYDILADIVQSDLPEYMLKELYENSGDPDLQSVLLDNQYISVDFLQEKATELFKKRFEEWGEDEAKIVHGFIFNESTPEEIWEI